MTLSRLILYLLVLVTSFARSNEPLTIHYRPTEYHIYYSDIIKLALEKTKAEYGEYKMVAVSNEFNTLRALSDVSLNVYGNMLIELGFDEDLNNSGNLSYINIPLDGGILGYRVCFVSPAQKQNVAKAKSLDDLKKFTVAQGVGWVDTKILRANGFKVIEVPIYNNIFKMITSNRVDLFYRGANQIKYEMESIKEIQGLEFDRSFVLVYDLPRFFYINKVNVIAKARIEKGLQIAFDDGSLKAIWEKHNRANLDYVSLDTRTMYKLRNPLLKNLNTDYRRYFFDPRIKP